METYSDLEKQGAQLPRELYTLYKSLEKNKEFLKLVYEARAEIGIPKMGLDHREYISENAKSKNDYWGASLKASIDISDELNLDPRVRMYMRYIILANFTYVPFEPIYARSERDVLEPKVEINITTKVTKNQFIRYINEHWSTIRTMMNLTFDGYLLAKKYVSERDFRIIELKENEGKTYNQIVDIVVREFEIDNKDLHVNEDSVKRAYHRAKEILDNAIR